MKAALEKIVYSKNNLSVLKDVRFLNNLFEAASVMKKIIPQGSSLNWCKDKSFNPYKY